MKIFLATLTLVFAFCFAQAETDTQIAMDTQATGSSSVINLPDALLGSTESIDTLGGGYYNWGRGRDGWGYCYEWDRYGRIRNGGWPVDNYKCERRNPSHFNWAQSRDGYTRCYQFTPYGDVMNQGRPVSTRYCGY